ncbi:MAG: ATP-binding cassette domain-containing protein, partial [Bacteroidales bacterium]|nr:ATP-binding cassette domain-containing protein [Bacteroidales bacterium]
MAIEVKNLNVYIKENHILKDVNILFPEKQITCIIGPSGCGKSTLLRTLNRLIDSTEHVRLEGQVLVDGV